MLRALLAGGALVAVSLPLAASGNPIVPELHGKVTARSISVRDMQGQRVHVLPPNTYRIVVTDSSKTQNFHLVGTDMSLRTRVAATGTRSWTVYLNPGTYVYKSDRSAKLRGTFKVSGVPPG